MNNKPQPPNPILHELQAIRRNTGCLVVMIFIAMLPVWLAVAALALGLLALPSSGY